MSTALRSWITSSTDFYKESLPDDPDEEAEADEEQTETDWTEMWAMCIFCGISDSEWEYMTIPKIRALFKVKRKNDEFQVRLNGGEVEDNRPIKATSLADLGFFLKEGSHGG